MAKVTSFPKDVIWIQHHDGKWFSRATTQQERKRREEFCKQRGWTCAGGCKR